MWKQWSDSHAYGDVLGLAHGSKLGQNRTSQWATFVGLADPRSSNYEINNHLINNRAPGLVYSICRTDTFSLFHTLVKVEILEIMIPQEGATLAKRGTIPL